MKTQWCHGQTACDPARWVKYEVSCDWRFQPPQYEYLSKARGTSASRGYLSWQDSRKWELPGTPSPRSRFPNGTGRNLEFPPKASKGRHRLHRWSHCAWQLPTWPQGGSLPPFPPAWGANAMMSFEDFEGKTSGPFSASMCNRWHSSCWRPSGYRLSKSIQWFESLRAHKTNSWKSLKESQKMIFTCYSSALWPLLRQRSWAKSDNQTPPLPERKQHSKDQD